MKIIKVKAIYNDAAKGERSISLTKWSNLEGFDMVISGNYELHPISMPFDEFYIIKDAVKVLDFEHNTCITKECKIWKSTVTVGITGDNNYYLISISNKGTTHTQQIKIKFDEFHFIKKAVRKLERGK